MRIESKALDWLASIIDLKPTHNMAKANEARWHTPNSTEKFVLTCCDIIHTEYTQSLTIKELAIRVGTNTTYLKHHFKQQTGLSIHDYLTQYRLKQAKSLLLQRPKLEIRAIAELCGYQAGRFSQLFKETYGITPSEYRLE